MLYLTFKHKGRRKHYYSDSIPSLVHDVLELFKNEQWVAKRYKNDHKRFIHNFLDGKVRFTGEQYEYFENIPELWGLSYWETEKFVQSLPEQLKKYIKLDTFNNLYYIEYDKGAYKLIDDVIKHLETN